MVFLNEAEERDPRFDQLHYRFAVPENQPGLLVGRVQLKPRKLRVNAQLRYTIVNSEMGSLFNITPVSYSRIALRMRFFIVFFYPSFFLSFSPSLSLEWRNLYQTRFGSRKTKPICLHGDAGRKTINIQNRKFCIPLLCINP